MPGDECKKLSYLARKVASFLAQKSKKCVRSAGRRGYTIAARSVPGGNEKGQPENGVKINITSF